MRVGRCIVLCGTVLCLWLASAAPSSAGPCTEQNEAPGIFVPVRGCFELGVGYQYQRFNVLSTSFNNNDYNADFGMHLFDLVTGAAGRLTVGVEGAATGDLAGIPAEILLST
jgi:hypothetical protein